MDTSEWYLFLLHSVRGRMLLLAALMVFFLVALHTYRWALENPYSRLARVLLVLGCVVVIAILLDLFGVFDVLVSN